VSETAAAEHGLRRRSKLLALVLAIFVPLAGFAYVRRLGWGVGFLLATPLLLLILGRLGVPLSPVGYWTTMCLVVLVAVVAIVVAVVQAHRLPAGAPPRWYNRWFHYVWLAVLALLVSNAMARHRGQLFGYDTFRIPSEAMEPTLVPGDFIVVQTAAPGGIHRGDLVIYRPAALPDQTWIKRVIGLPGESVVVKGNGVEIDGAPLAEPWATIREPVVPVPVPFERVRLGEGQYFLLGDNRPNSEDSRFTGPVSANALLGKARAIWLHYSPAAGGIDISRIGVLPHAEGN
jgi:signal peptidase I